MNKEKIIELQGKVQKVLGEQRFTHTLGVAYTSAALAMRYEEDMDKAFLCGILHDCAKALTLEEQVNDCERYAISLSDAERKNPKLIHAKLGAYFASSEYEIDDEEISQAILCHTTGKPGMTTLEKILYVADCIEPTRVQGDYLVECRRLAFVDLDECLFQLLEKGLAYLKTTQDVIDPATKETYNYYKNEREQRRN